MPFGSTSPPARAGDSVADVDAGAGGGGGARAGVVIGDGWWENLEEYIRAVTPAPVAAPAAAIAANAALDISSDYGVRLMPKKVWFERRQKATALTHERTNTP